MQGQVSSTRSATGNSKLVLRALGGMVLALAVAGGVVLWQGTGQQDQQTASTVASEQAEAVTIESTASVFGASATPAQIQSAALGEGSIIYIAGSEDEAGYLRRFTAEINALAVEAGRLPRGVTVMVAGSADDDAKVQVQIAQLLDVQHGMGWPVSRVVDLRASSASGGPR